MEIAKIRNDALRARAIAAQQRSNALSVMALRKIRKRSMEELVEAGLAGRRVTAAPTGTGDIAVNRHARSAEVTNAADWIAEVVSAHTKPRLQSCWQRELDHFARLARALAAVRASILDKRIGVTAIWRVARFAQSSSFIRSPESFRPAKSKSVERQVTHFLRHLFCRYRITDVFDGCWWDSQLGAEAACRWWLHLASGQSMRTAPGLPIELTRRMAHEVTHSLVPGVAAIRYAHFVSFGVSPQLAKAVAESGIGAWPRLAEARWDGFARFLVANPDFPPAQVRPVVDFVDAQRELNGTEFNFRGRSGSSVQRLIGDWHHRIARMERYAYVGKWAPCAIKGMDRREGEGVNSRLFRVVELLDSRELVEEGSAMRHCVGSYARRCARRESAIFSLRVVSAARLERLVTIEVQISTRQIVQARGKCNRLPDAVELRVLRVWAAHANVTLAQM